MDWDYAHKSWKWTNALWATATSTLINRWQARQDGYTMFLNWARDGNGDAITEYDPVTQSQVGVKHNSK